MSAHSGESVSTVSVPADKIWRLLVGVIVVGFFATYWISSEVLVARDGTTHFGGDPWLYAELSKASFLDRTEDLARITRFHPLTVFIALSWMRISVPLTAWLTPDQILRAAFAAFGAIGVWGAISAFAAVVPRRQALLWGAIYGVSLGVWYFSSIEESKALSAALTAVYIAIYVRLRCEWTTRRAFWLNFVLVAACLNEIVAVFLVAIPALDALVQRGIDLKHDYWIALHGLIGPATFVFMEITARLILPAPEHAEGASHFDMLIYYVTQNDYSLTGLYMFSVRWLFFNIAAPERTAIHWAKPEVGYGGDFLPSLGSYFTSPLSTVLALVVIGLAIALLVPRWRGRIEAGHRALLIGLAGYALVRMLFFLIFNPWECLLFASGVTLPHLMLTAIPLAVSRFAGKEGFLLVLAGLILASNARFIIG